jgi:hypothetical protein
VIVHALKEHDLVVRIHYLNCFLRSILDRKVDSQLVFFLMRLCFPYIERCILIIGTGVQIFKDLHTNILFMMKRLVFGVR